MAGVAQADRARCDTSGGPSGYRQSYWDRPVRCHSGNRAVPQGRVESYQYARRWRDRTCHISFRAYPAWRSAPDRKRLTQLHRDLIIELAARHKLPAIYFERRFASAGGLISYEPDYVDE